MPLNHFNWKRSSANKASLLICLLAVVIAVAGCGLIDRFQASTSDSNVASTSNGNSGTTSPSQTRDNAAEGLCENEYYPVYPTMIRRYEIKGSGPAKYTLTQRDISESGFKEDRDFESGLKVTNSWLCTEEGLRTAEFTNTGVMTNARFEMETVKSSGVTIPKDPEPGMKFDATYDVSVKVKAGPVSADATGEVKIANAVASVGESVEVNGQTFNTIRIDSTINVTINMRGRRIEGARVTASNWYSKEAGLVKQETGGTFGKQFLEIVSTERK